MFGIRSITRGLAVLAAILVFCVATAVPLLALPRGKQQEQAIKETPEEVAAGKQIFETTCSTCHGLDAGGGMGPNIQGVPFRLGAETVANFIKNGIPAAGMPAFGGQLNDAQIHQVIIYLLTLKAKDTSVVNGNAEKGKEAYDSAGCATCHMIKGEGGDTGPDLSNVGALRGVNYLRTTLLYPGTDLPQQPVRLETGGYMQYMYVHVVTKDGHTVDGTRITEDSFKITIEDAKGEFHTFLKGDLRTLEKQPGKSLMPSYRDKLSPDQINDLVAYLASLKEAQ